MSTLAEFQQAFEQLDERAAWELKAWIDARLEDAWDRQIERDAEAGRLDTLWDAAKREVQEGRTRPLDELLNDR